MGDSSSVPSAPGMHHPMWSIACALIALSPLHQCDNLIAHPQCRCLNVVPSGPVSKTGF